MRVFALSGVPEIAAGMDLAQIIATRARTQGVLAGDVVCVAHKVVSKAEGRVRALRDFAPGPAASLLADETGKDPRLCEAILSESRRIVRQRGGTVVCETYHGYVCANAGIDASNVADGYVVLLPRDPDASARRIQAAVAAAVGGRVGVVVTDTHGRAWRRGLVNVALGVAGFQALVDHRGATDRTGRVLVATDQALADEIAAVAGMLMGKASGTPAVVVSGVVTTPSPGGVGTLLRHPDHDLFR